MRALIVDDEVVIRKGIVKLLDRPGGSVNRIAEARNGEEALHLMASERPDLLITDIQMPVMDGLELIARARKLYPELAIVVLSGYAEFKYVQEALRHQAADYLLKPVTGEKLQEVISRVLINDPTKWTIKLNEESIRIMKETIAALVRSVLAEHAEEADGLMEQWGGHLRSEGLTLLEAKRVMGHFGLFFRSELLLAHKRSAQDEHAAPSLTSSSIDGLIGEWKAYLREEIRTVAGSRAPRNKRVVEEALGLIRRDYGDAGLNLQRLAAHCGLNPPYLSKIFREVMSKPITQYISEFRLEKARELLLREDAPTIAAIAEQCGFSDYPYFSKIFKKAYGVPPAEYKEKNSG